MTTKWMTAFELFKDEFKKKNLGDRFSDEGFGVLWEIHNNLKRWENFVNPELKCLVYRELTREEIEKKANQEEKTVEQWLGKYGVARLGNGGAIVTGLPRSEAKKLINIKNSLEKHGIKSLIHSCGFVINEDLKLIVIDHESYVVFEVFFSEKQFTLYDGEEKHLGNFKTEEDVLKHIIEE